MCVLNILFYNVFNEIDAEEIGINKGDFTCFYNKLEKYRDNLYLAGIITSSFDTLIQIINNANISYNTDDAQFNGNTIHVVDQFEFCKLCNHTKNVDVFDAWLSVIKGLSWDIDTLEYQYSDKSTGRFLRSVLVYFAQFTIATEL